MKYIDADLLRAEIERYNAGAQSAYNPHDEYADFYYGKVIACEDLLDFLATLPEQPVKSLPEWKWVKPDKQYPVGITREMDVNGDWQYCMSSGRLYEFCQYLSLAELELKSVDAGPYPIEEQAADEKAVKEIVKTVHKEVARQVKEMVKEQSASEGLEKEVRKYLTDNFTPPSEEPLNTEDAAYTLWFDDVRDLARHFAEWAVKQKPIIIQVENPNIQKLDPNVIIETRTNGTGEPYREPIPGVKKVF